MILPNRRTLSPTPRRHSCLLRKLRRCGTNLPRFGFFNRKEQIFGTLEIRVLAATFSPELADYSIYVIDVAAGDKIPRKVGPGITRSDLLVINKTDLAPHVGADLNIMNRDAKKMRGDLPFIFSNLKTGEGLSSVVDWILLKMTILKTPESPVHT